MIEKYKSYLRVIDEKLFNIRKAQAPYIFCKTGCSTCCTQGQYPYSEVEFLYLMEGFNLLSDSIKDEISKKIDAIKLEEKQFEGEKFTYDCPFLINNMCSVYEHRGLICRVFGVPWFDDSGKIIIPACVYDGLNYSSVYDHKTGCFLTELYEKTGFVTEPLAYNLSMKTLLNNDGTEYLGLVFGKQKSLIDWL